MRCLLVIPLALVLAAPVAWGRDEKGKDPPKGDTVADQIATLKKEFETGSQGLRQSYEDAKTQEEKQKIIQQYQELQGGTATKLLELAEKNAKNPAAVDALTLVLQYARNQQDRQKAITALTTEHLQSERIGAACSMLIRMPDGEKHVRAIIEKNANHDVQGQARFALGSFLKQKIGQMQGDEEKAKLKTEAEKTLDEVVGKYADVKVDGKPIANMAKSLLAGLRAQANLAVGKQAPEIEGEDADGKKFKLSDYRGKVIVLDFWAGW
jgi:hypothetical protein